MSISNILKKLKNFYLISIVFLFVLIIFTPYLISSKFLIFEEEILEPIAIAILFGISAIMYYFYNLQLEKSCNDLNEAMLHVGAINVEMDHLREVFKNIDKYPENKEDLKYIFDFLAEKILVIAGCEWVIFRIIETSSLRTLTEFNRSKKEGLVFQGEISNRALTENEKIAGCRFFSSAQKNLNIRTFCIISEKEVGEISQKTIESIINSLGMLYIIFDSIYYKNTRL